MKTVEETRTGLPSFETEWPNDAEMEHAPTLTDASWASERLQRMMQTSAWENAWRGFPEYDSPLAG